MRAVLLLGLLFTTSAVAAPQQLHHSGRLLDTSGVPLDNTHDLDVALFDAASGGSALWSEAHLAELFDNGYFSIELGSASPISDNVLDSGDLWIELSVDGSVLGRQPLASVPYARFASRAGSVDGTVLEDLGCATGQLPLYSGSSWGCANDQTLDEAAVDSFVTNNGYALASDLSNLDASLATLARTGSWGDLANIPADFADGVDNMLDEAAVDAFVANNGYALAADIISLSAGLAPIATSGSWNDLADIPAGFADDVDNTLSSAQVLGYVEAGGLSLAGSLQVADDATACTSANAGAIRFSAGSFQGCDGASWVNLYQPYGTRSNPGASCLDILGARPSAPSGLYFIVPPAGGAAIQVSCDMVADGGGYTYYPISGGTSTCAFTDNNDCKALGMGIVMPRSEAHWQSMLAEFGASYFTVIPGVYRSTGSGSYTSCVMRDPNTYGSGCADWRVGDGGAWWVRDTTFSEPNGDYTANCWLGITTAGYPPVSAATISGGQGFNDGGCSYCTTSYLCSTNDK